MKCYFRGCSNQIKPDGIYDKFDQINKSISEYSNNYANPTWVQTIRHMN